eukprot:gene32083-36219_t
MNWSRFFVQYRNLYNDVSDIKLRSDILSGATSLASLKGKIIGVLSGSTGEKWAQEHKDEYGFAEVKGYNAQQDVMLDLNAGRVDGVVSDVPGMEFLFTKMKGLKVKERIKTGEQYGLMMTKDHPKLQALSDAIGAMKKDGTLAAIHKKWFGTDAPAGSSTVTE